MVEIVVSEASCPGLYLGEEQVMEKSEKVRWVKTSSGQRGHRECWENYNDTIQCGQEHGDCGSTECCFSEKYVRPATSIQET